MDFRFRPVPKLPYTDTSDTQSRQIIRQIRQTRRDIKNTAMDLADAINGKRDGNSPYVPDRKHLNPNKVYQSRNEDSWKEVDSYAQTRHRILNLKKLDVI